MNSQNQDANAVVFKSALNGYKRDDVNEYILAMNRRFKEAEDNYRETIESLRKRLEEEAANHRTEAAAHAEAMNNATDAMNRAVAEERAKIKTLQDRLDETEEKLKASTASEAEARSLLGVLENRIEETDAKLEEYQDEIEKLKQLIASYEEKLLNAAAAPVPPTTAEDDSGADEYEKKIEELKAELSQKDAEIAALRKEADDARAAASADYTRLSARVGDIIINANNAAEELIKRAKAEAAAIKAKSEANAAYMRESFGECADTVIRSVTADIGITADGIMSEAASSIAQLLDQATHLIDALEAKKKECSERTCIFSENARAALEKKADELKAALEK